MDYFNKDPQVGLVYSKYITFCNGKELRTNPKKGHSGWVFSKLISRSFIQTSTVMVKRECLDAVGPFDESFTLSDEYDLFLRVAEKFQCGFIDKALTRYRIHDGNASKDNFRFDMENLKVFKKIYGNSNGLDTKCKKLLRERIAKYNMNVAGRLYARGQLEDSERYHKEALDYMPFYKRIFMNRRFKYNAVKP